MATFYIMIIPIILVALMFTVCLTIVPQNEVYIIERGGEYKTTWQTGLHFKVPFVDKVARKIVLKEHMADFSIKSVVSKDNVTMRIEIAVFYQVTDPKRFAYGERNPIMAIEENAAVSLNDLMGEYDYNSIPQARELIGQKLSDHLDIAISTMGIKINRAELGSIKESAQI